MNMKKKYVKPQVECYVIKNPCLLLVSGTEQENTGDTPEYRGPLGWPLTLMPPLSRLVLSRCLCQTVSSVWVSSVLRIRLLRVLTSPIHLSPSCIMQRLSAQSHWRVSYCPHRWRNCQKATLMVARLWHLWHAMPRSLLWQRKTVSPMPFAKSTTFPATRPPMPPREWTSSR